MLWEIQHSATLIIERTAGLTAEDIRNDIWLRAGIERHFEIVGETARRLIDYDPEVAAKIPLLLPAVRMRNFLAHNYDRVDYAQMRDTINGPLVVLNRAVSELLKEVGET